MTITITTAVSVLVPTSVAVPPARKTLETAVELVTGKLMPLPPEKGWSSVEGWARKERLRRKSVTPAERAIGGRSKWCWKCGTGTHTRKRWTGARRSEARDPATASTKPTIRTTYSVRLRPSFRDRTGQFFAICTPYSRRTIIPLPGALLIAISITIIIIIAIVCLRLVVVVKPSLMPH